MNFFSTTVSPQAIELVNKVLKSTRISAGEMADTFERKLMEKYDLNNITVVNSGTSALHLIMKILHLRKGDEVILPAQTFIATGLAVLYEGGTPVFADIKREDGNIDVKSIERKITDRTKAIICVDWAGYPCLPYNSKVITKTNGIIEEKNIGDLVNEKPDYVLGAFENQIVWTKCIIAKKQNDKKKLIKITTDDDSIIEATENHKFYTDEMGWIEAKNLHKNLSLNKLMLYEKNIYRRTNSFIETDLRESKNKRRNIKLFPKSYLGTNKMESKLFQSKLDETDEIKYETHFKPNDATGNSIFSRYNRRGRFNISNTAKKINFNTNDYDIQYEQKINRLSCKSSGIFTENTSEKAKKNGTKNLLYASMEGVKSRRTVDDNNSLFNNKEGTSGNIIELLYKTSIATCSNENRQERLFNSGENTQTKWTKIKTIEHLNDLEDVFDISTTTGNFYANGILVHNCDYKEIRFLARKNNLLTVADCAHSIGSTYHTKQAGKYANYTCFLGTTSVITNNGNVNLNKIKIGDKVLTEDNNYHEVINVIKQSYKGKWVKIKAGQTRLVMTEEHPVKVHRDGNDAWLEAKEINCNDSIYVATKKCTICNVELIPFYGKICSKCFLEADKNNKVNKYEKTKDHPYDDVIWITKTKKRIAKRYKYEIINNFARIPICSIEKGDWKDRTKIVYNLTVKENPTFFAHGILVHNCFSFQAIKHLTTGDGGAIVCPYSATEIKKLRWFFIDRDNDKPSHLGERVYDATKIGYKYHMNDIAGAMGVGNLEVIDTKLERLRNIAKRYFDELKNCSGLKLMQYSDDRVSSYWLFPILVEDRYNFIKKMKESGIPTSVVHLGIDKNSIFGGIKEDLVNQRYWDNNQIHIPINDELTDDDVTNVIETIKSGW